MPPSRPCPTPIQKRRARSIWPGRPPSRSAPTGPGRLTRTPTGWLSWCRVPPGGMRSPGTSSALSWAMRCWPALARGEPVADAGGRPPVVATTVVSGSLLRRLADAAGVRCVTTLTGFKWIARAGGDDGLIYGYEQATGYAVRPDLVADKDGISAALLVLQLAAEEAQRDRTLLDRLDDIALAHGLHVTGQRLLHADGAAGLAQLADAVEQRQEGAAAPAGRTAGHGDRPARRRRGRGGPGRRSRRALPRPAAPGGGRPDLARRRRRAGDDPAERHGARTQDLRRGCPSGTVAG